MGGVMSDEVIALSRRDGEVAVTTGLVTRDNVMLVPAAMASL